MSYLPTSPKSPLDDPLDILLAEVAIRVQLCQTDYNRSVDRYQAINNWIEHDGSPLKDQVVGVLLFLNRMSIIYQSPEVHRRFN